MRFAAAQSTCTSAQACLLACLPDHFYMRIDGKIQKKSAAAASAAGAETMSSILDDIKADIKSIIVEKNCGPIFIRLSWHDAGVYSTGKLTGGELLVAIVVL